MLLNQADLHTDGGGGGGGGGDSRVQVSNINEGALCDWIHRKIKSYLFVWCLQLYQKLSQTALLHLLCVNSRCVSVLLRKRRIWKKD
ncbi:hypothetical protein L6452_04889 [Arctium lappa]|uniref:Uncharacterized protein n=1 Tax=Arctium lappa TaxID=4217 RepID=A0ACB9EFG6_ARCLA|nr:hypothetical protein L6452_04889 [Arctium lappa]